MNWIFGDNINTDLITPGRYNITTNPRDMASIAFIEYRPEFAKTVKKGDFLVAGNNFGCGSSRETAAIALKFSGIRAILATSFARIFYRNCLNHGLLAVMVDTSDIDEQDILLLNIEKRLLQNTTKKWERTIDLPEFAVTLHTTNGVIPYIKKHGIEGLSALNRSTTKKHHKL